MSKWRETALDCHEYDMEAGSRDQAGDVAEFSQGLTCVLAGDFCGDMDNPGIPWFIRVRSTLTFPDRKSRTRHRVVTVSACVDPLGESDTSRVRKPAIMMQLTAQHARELGQALVDAADLNCIAKLTD